MKLFSAPQSSKAHAWVLPLDVWTSTKKDNNFLFCRLVFKPSAEAALSTGALSFLILSSF
jgi:hypothetical protein